MADREQKTLFCYCHVGGKLVVNADRSVSYEGGTVDGLVIDENITHDAFIAGICDRLRITPTCKLFHYSLKFDKSCLLPLKDQQALNAFLSFNDGAGCVYVDSQEVIPFAPPSPRGSNIDNQPISERSVEVEHDGGGSLGVEGCTSSDGTPAVLNEWKEEIIGGGQQFDSPNAFRESLYKYALAKSFRYRYTKNNGDRFSVRCAVDSCPWKITARRIKCGDAVVVKTMYDVHEHPEQCAKELKPLFRSKFAAALIKEKIKSSPGYRPTEICKDLRSAHDVNITYGQSYRLKEFLNETIYGKPEDSYKLIPKVCQHIVDIMPGSVATWTSGEDNRLKQIFVAYNCSIRGFQLGCRPLLFVDDFFVARPYRGALLSVNALDANDEVFPVAYALIYSDDIDWIWFLEKLKSLVGERDTVVVYKKNEYMLTQLHEIFGAENHCYSYWHLKEKFSSYVDTLKLGHNGKKNAIALMDSIMYARLQSDYEKALYMMRKFHGELYEWIMTNSPSNWAISQFKKRRWDKCGSDFAQSFNSWMLDESQLPLVEFMTKHKEKVAQIFLDRCREVASWKSTVGEKIGKKVRENLLKAGQLIFTRLSGSQFEFMSDRSIIHVDLEKMACSCYEWQMIGIPCAHACSVMQWANLDVYEFVEKCYHRDSQNVIYAELMPDTPLFNMPDDDTVESGECTSSHLLPPYAKQPPGRPPEKQYKYNTQPTSKRALHCSLCSEAGHTRRTCKNGSHSLLTMQ